MKHIFVILMISVPMSSTKVVIPVTRPDVHKALVSDILDLMSTKSNKPSLGSSEEYARISNIADDLLDVALDRSMPNLYPDDYSRMKTLSVMLATIDAESGFRRDVDYGLYNEVHQSQDWCLMQIRLGFKNGDSARKFRFSGQTFKYDPHIGYSGRELARDRKACFTAGLYVLKASFQACRNVPERNRLAMYLSGSCDKATRQSAQRMRVATRLNIHEFDNYDASELQYKSLRILD